jgi:regulator of PEP synthase PpsR (kinase-PPPase family)
MARRYSSHLRLARRIKPGLHHGIAIQRQTFDCFQVFIAPLEQELGSCAMHAIGRTHNVNDIVNYYRHIEAVNYTLSHDDGVSTRELAEADVILAGVSRCGNPHLFVSLDAIRYPRGNLPANPGGFFRQAAARNDTTAV